MSSHTIEPLDGLCSSRACFVQARQLEPQGTAVLLQTRLQIRARYAPCLASPSCLLFLLHTCSRARAGRKITFADFAFFDSEQYKILFELVRSAVRNRPHVVRVVA